MFKFRNNDVYINEHLSKVNRAIFGAAQAKKKLLKYKYCWTRGGTVYMRKTDESDVITITKEKDLDDLVQSVVCIVVSTKVSFQKEEMQLKVENSPHFSTFKIQFA